MAKINLQLGDRIALSRAFLKSTGNNYAAAQRRGTLLALPAGGVGLARVVWDDYDTATFARHAAQWGEDFAQDERDNGSCVNVANLCRVGSAAFAN